MTNRIFILNGHPADTSLNMALAQTYAVAAKAAGNDVRTQNLSEMDFDIDYGLSGFENPKPLEPTLETMMQNIEWCEHLVLVTPMWWGGIPAKLKGAIDRTFLPGRAFDSRVPPGKMPLPMLSGRSARVILTSDTPRWILSLMYRSAIVHQLRKQVLKFVGITPTRFTFLSGASHPKTGQVDSWLKQISALGRSAR